MLGQFYFVCLDEVKHSTKCGKFSNITIREVNENGELKAGTKKYPIFGNEICDKFSRLKENSYIEMEYESKEIYISDVKQYD